MPARSGKGSGGTGPGARGRGLCRAAPRSRGAYYLMPAASQAALTSADADLARLVDLVLDDRGRDVVLGHDLRVVQLGGDALDLAAEAVDLGVRQGVDLLALEQLDRDLGRGVGLRLDLLVDRERLVALEDPLQAREFGVLAADRDLDALLLERGDDAAGHAVVAGVDALEAVLAERVEGRAHLLVGLVRRPVGDVLLVRDLLDLLVEDAVGALLEERHVRVGRRAVDHDDIAVLGLVAERLDQRLALQAADLLVVVGHVGGDLALGQPVVRDDLDALLGGLVRPRTWWPCSRRRPE